MSVDTHTSLKAKILRLDKKKQRYLDLAAAVQSEIEEMQAKQVQLLKSYMAEMGVNVTVRQPSNGRKTVKCSICISQGMGGEGHTAARHHLLIVKGELKEPEQP